jgi:hypothetical protein
MVFRAVPLRKPAPGDYNQEYSTERRRGQIPEHSTRQKRKGRQIQATAALGKRAIPKFRISDADALLHPAMANALGALTSALCALARQHSGKLKAKNQHRDGE